MFVNVDKIILKHSEGVWINGLPFQELFLHFFYSIGVAILPQFNRTLIHPVG